MHERRSEDMGFGHRQIERTIAVARIIVIAPTDAGSRKRAVSDASEVHPAAADEHAVSGRERVIDADIVLRATAHLRGTRGVIGPRAAGEIRFRPEAHHPRCDWIPAINRNAVARKG